MRFNVTSHDTAARTTTIIGVPSRHLIDTLFKHNLNNDPTKNTWILLLKLAGSFEVLFLKIFLKYFTTAIPIVKNFIYFYNLLSK